MTALHEKVVEGDALAPLTGLPDLDQRELAGAECGHELQGAVWRFTKRGEDHTVRIRSRFQVNDGRVLCAAAAAGHGIVLQPEAVLQDAIEQGSLVPLLTDYRAPGRSMFL